MHFTGPQSNSQMVMTLKHCCLGSDLNYLLPFVQTYLVASHKRYWNIIICSFIYKAFSVHEKETMLARGTLHYLRQSSVQKINLGRLMQKKQKTLIWFPEKPVKNSSNCLGEDRTATCLQIIWLNNAKLTSSMRTEDHFFLPPCICIWLYHPTHLKQILKRLRDWRVFPSGSRQDEHTLACRVASEKKTIQEWKA